MPECFNRQQGEPIAEADPAGARVQHVAVDEVAALAVKAVPQPGEPPDGVRSGRHGGGEWRRSTASPARQLQGSSVTTSATGLNRRGAARLADHLMRALQCALNPWGPLESASFQGIPHLDNPTRTTRDATISGPLANVREPRGQRHKILRAPKAVQLHGPSLQPTDDG